MKIRVSALCTLLFILVAPLMAQQVSVNYVKTQNFAGFHTYAWGEENAEQLVWRGITQGTLSNKGDKNQSLVHKAVEKMVKKYPKT